ncbi:MAG: sugar phosphate nucleotidyltransferase [Candidatus Woesearchaeota archaeon]
MQLIMPMAGRGSRLRPHTWNKPKPLVKVAGKTVLNHIIDRILDQVEIDEGIFITSGMEDQVREVLDRYDFEQHFFHQEELRGDADALLTARGAVTGPALIVFCDTLFSADLTGLESFKDDAIFWCKEVPDARSFGVVELKDGYVTNIIEKSPDPPTNLAIIGLYYFKDVSRIFEFIDEIFEKNITSKGEYRLADASARFIKAGARITVREVGDWLDCGTAQNLITTNRRLIELDSNLVCVKPTISVNSVIDPKVCLGGNVELDHSVIGPNVSVGKNVVIRNSVVQDSIIDDNVTIENLVLKDSIVGRDAVVKANQRSMNVGDNSVLEY